MFLNLRMSSLFLILSHDVTRTLGFDLNLWPREGLPRFVLKGLFNNFFMEKLLKVIQVLIY